MVIGMKDKNNKFKLPVVKYKALQLRNFHQIPFQLCYFIQKLDSNSDIEWIKYLIGQTEMMLRVRGFYKKYPQIEEEFNKVIIEDSKKFNW